MRRIVATRATLWFQSSIRNGECWTSSQWNSRGNLCSWWKSWLAILTELYENDFRGRWRGIVCDWRLSNNESFAVYLQLKNWMRRKYRRSIPDGKWYVCVSQTVQVIQPCQSVASTEWVKQWTKTWLHSNRNIANVSTLISSSNIRTVDSIAWPPTTEMLHTICSYDCYRFSSRTLGMKAAQEDHKRMFFMKRQTTEVVVCIISSGVSKKKHFT